MMKLRIPVIACAMLAASLLPAAAEPALTVFLVRHAEKASSGGDDPSLSDAGRHRAETLAATLADAGITAIFTSEYKRARETAEPLSRKLGVTPTVVSARDLDGLVAKLRALGPGGRALVVGHSNTVPAVATRLTGVKLADFADTEFDKLLVARSVKDGDGEVVTLHCAP